MKRSDTTESQQALADPWILGRVVQVLVLVAFVAALTVPTGLVPIVAVAFHQDVAAVREEGPVIIPLAPIEPTATATPIYTPTPHVPRVGIIAGHSGHDTGAVCDDGLQEVEVNQAIAELVVKQLIRLGYRAEQLEEFDGRLRDYRADVLLSIHADSCNVPGKTGFKVARVEGSYIPGAEDRLVACLSERYAQRTGLVFDPYTITFDMTQYHAFYEINPDTPAAIIETGFMLDDRDLLVGQPELVAQGIVDGLVCFLNGETP